MTDRADPRSAPRSFDFAEACALLGGAPGTDERLARGQQWLFAGDSARWPLEVLRLELCLFLDVCAKVAALPAAARASPAVRVSLADASGAPARWCMRAEVEPGAAVAAAEAGAELRALGVMLLQALLVDDSQDLRAVTGAFDGCLRRLEAEAGAERGDLPALVARLPQLLAAKDLRGACEPVHLLFRASDRTSVSQLAAPGQPLVAPSLWWPLLVAAGRALAAWPPFAFAVGPDALTQLGAEVRSIVGRLDDELFHAAERDAAVAAACAEAAESLRDGPRGSPAPAEDPATVSGFRLLVRRDGDAQSQELRYEIDRVTIGRREGENLLRLNDPMVSSMHAAIEHTPDGWVVFDRNSTNGTEVDGIRLPGEVPQPLQDGSVIVIRPFRLTFHTLVATQMLKPAPALTVAALRDRLHDVHARERPLGSLRVHEAMLAAIDGAGSGIAADARLRCLDELARAAPPASSATSAEPVERPLDAAAARALLQLSRSLLGTAEFTTVEQVQQFAGKLGRFVDATAHWIERMLELRKALGKHLDLGQVSTASGRTQVRSAADVRALVAGWQTDAPAVDAAAWYIAKFYDDVVAILVGLLEVNQQVRKAVRERLDPARLVDIAGRAAAARAQVQAAMSSPLWQEYVQAFGEVTGSAANDAEFAQLLQRVAALQTQRS